ESPILRANLFFRALVLPAGNHRVEFRYQPRSFAIGLVVSLLSLVTMSAWILYRGLQQKRAALLTNRIAPRTPAAISCGWICAGVLLRNDRGVGGSLVS